MHYKTPTPLNLSFVNDFSRDIEHFKAVKIKAENARFEFLQAEYKYQSGYIGQEEFRLKREQWIACVKEMRAMLMSNTHEIPLQNHAY
jgi:hypothetical protein